MRERMAKAADVTAHIVETVMMVVLALCLVAGFLAQFWINEGRAVVRFGDHHETYVEPARPGDETVVHMPLMVVRRCIPIQEASRRYVRQEELEIVDEMVGAVPDFGPVGEWQGDFEFAVLVPDELKAGKASFTWSILWDCGLRRVETQTPLAIMDVLPPVR